MTFDDRVLNRLVPALPWNPDWVEVLARAGEIDQRRRRPSVRRRRILSLAGLAIVLISLIVLSAATRLRLHG
jgi:hypothetical protein